MATTNEQVLLKLGIDQSQVGPGLNDFQGKVKAAVGNVTEHLDKMANGARGFHKALHGLNEFLPGFGSLAAVAFNPIALAITGAGMALSYFERKIEETNKLLDEMGEINARRIGDMKRAIEEAASEMDRLNREFDKWIASHNQEGTKIVDGLERQLELLRSQGKVNERLLEQKHALAEAQIDRNVGSGRMGAWEGAEAKAKLDIQFAREKRQGELAAAQAELDAQKKARAELEADKGKAAAAVMQAKEGVEAGINPESANLKHKIESDREVRAAMNPQWAEAKRKFDQQSELAERQRENGAYGAGQEPRALTEARRQFDELDRSRQASIKLEEEERKKLQEYNDQQDRAKDKLKESESVYDRLMSQWRAAGKEIDRTSLKLQELQKSPLGLKGGRGGGALTEGSRATLEELANSGSWQRHGPVSIWQQSPWANQAREVMRLQGDARQANVMGNFDRRDDDNKRITQLKAELGKSGALKESEFLDAIDENIARLLSLASTEGLKVNPAMAP